MMPVKTGLSDVGALGLESSPRAKRDGDGADGGFGQIFEAESRGGKRLDGSDAEPAAARETSPPQEMADGQQPAEDDLCAFEQDSAALQDLAPEQVIDGQIEVVSTIDAAVLDEELTSDPALDSAEVLTEASAAGENIAASGGKELPDLPVRDVPPSFAGSELAEFPEQLEESTVVASNRATGVSLQEPEVAQVKGARVPTDPAVDVPPPSSKAPVAIPEPLRRDSMQAAVADHAMPAEPAREPATANVASAASESERRPANGLLEAFRFGRLFQEAANSPREPAPVQSAQVAVSGIETKGPADLVSALGGSAALFHRDGALPPPLPAPAGLGIGVSVGQRGWDQAVGERMVWMARQGMQEAQIQLTPRDMGPIEIRLSIQHDQATVSFAAQHPGTREALEAALPKLREMFAESGLNLAQSEVSQQSPQQRGEGGAGANFGAHNVNTADGIGESTTDIPSEKVAASSGRGLVDFFA